MPRVVKRTPVMLLTTSLTISGRLRCVNIEKGDAKGGQAYACHTINYFINKPVTLLTTSLTISGRLRFVNIEKGDAKGRQAYACHTINYFINNFRSSEVCEHREG